MATEKILNTRIQLKYDSYDNWQGSTVVLKAGEVAIAYLGETVSDKIKGENRPVLFKVGDGVKTFANLPWASALAADVYDWAKQSENDFVNTFLTLKMTDGTTVQSKLDAVFATDKALTDAIAEVREEITNLSVSALEARVKAIEDDYLQAADIADMATDAEVAAAVKTETDRATEAEEALGERIDGIVETELPAALVPYAKTADVVTNEEFSAFETTNTQAIADAKTGAETTASNALAAARTEISKEIDDDVKVATDRANEAYNLADAKLDSSTYATDKAALEAEDAAIREMAEDTKSRVEAFLDGEGVANTVDSLKEIQAELDRLGDAVELESQFAAKADKVANATSGNFAGLDANGNLTDSGKKAADFEVAGAAAAAQAAAEAKVTALAEGAVANNTAAIGNINTKFNDYYTKEEAEAAFMDSDEVATAISNALNGENAITVDKALVAEKASGLDASGEAAVKAVKVDNATHADAATKVDNKLSITANGTATEYDGSEAKSVDLDAVYLKKTDYVNTTYTADETSLHLEDEEFSVKDRGITAEKTAAFREDNGSSAETWVFYCGTASELV